MTKIITAYLTQYRIGRVTDDPTLPNVFVYGDFICDTICCFGEYTTQEVYDKIKKANELSGDSVLFIDKIVVKTYRCHMTEENFVRKCREITKNEQEDIRESIIVKNTTTKIDVLEISTVDGVKTLNVSNYEKPVKLSHTGAIKYIQSKTQNPFVIDKINYVTTKGYIPVDEFFEQSAVVPYDESL